MAEAGQVYVAASEPSPKGVDSLTVKSGTVIAYNTADQGGGVYVEAGPIVASTGADWGDADLDNVPDDVATVTMSYAGYEDPETFTCADGRCDPQP